jgi:purine-nucleoside phosphorylase
MTPHNEAKKDEIAKTVIMPGDPLRAKYIAEKFLKGAKLVNKVRGMYAYTGKYKGKAVTVMAHGMGIPSAGIYIYELYKFYDVENIIRVGSCGGFGSDLKLLDTVLVDKAYTESNFAYTFNNEDVKLVQSSEEINNIIENIAEEKSIPYVKGNVFSSDVFDLYATDIKQAHERQPKDANLIGAEMESFVLFYLSKLFNRRASCLLTVVDTHTDKRQVSTETRQTALNDMIELALETAIKL